MKTMPWGVVPDFCNGRSPTRRSGPQIVLTKSRGTTYSLNCNGDYIYIYTSQYKSCMYDMTENMDSRSTYSLRQAKEVLYVSEDQWFVPPGRCDQLILRFPGCDVQLCVSRERWASWLKSIVRSGLKTGINIPSIFQDFPLESIFFQIFLDGNLTPFSPHPINFLVDIIYGAIIIP